MENQMKAALLAAALTGTLVTGCGSRQNVAHNAENPRTTDAAITDANRRNESARVTDRDNSLYEEDDVHRKTDREPDLFERADSALDRAESYVESMVTDAERAMDSIAE